MEKLSTIAAITFGAIAICSPAMAAPTAAQSSECFKASHDKPDSDWREFYLACLAEYYTPEEKAAEAAKSRAAKAANDKAAAAKAAAAKAAKERRDATQAEVDTSRAWVCYETRDAMRDTVSPTCRQTSLNSANFGWPYGGENHLKLIIGKRRDKVRGANIVIDAGQLRTDHGDYTRDDGYISVKVGTGPIKTFRVAASTTSDPTVGIITNPAFIKLIESGGKVVIEAHFYREGAVQFEFDMEPFPPQLR